MRYFERLRRSLRPENRRCMQQPRYSIMFQDGRKYYCRDHYGLIKDGWNDVTLADGETGRCGYEV